MLSCAVSDKIGRGSLFIRKNDTAIVSIAEDTNGSIKIDTLENIIKNKKITSIHGLKIDIEGHEDKALVPFLNNIEKNLLPERIVIERQSSNSDYPGCTLAFKKLNYTLVARSRNNSFYKRVMTSINYNLKLLNLLRHVQSYAILQLVSMIFYN